MAESISEPVSPVSESDERSPIEWPEGKPDKELAVKRHINSLSTEIDTSLDKHCNPLTLQYTRQSSIISSTDPLLPFQNDARRYPAISEQLGIWNIVVIFIGSLYGLFILGFLWFLWGGHKDIPFWQWLVWKGYVQRAVTLCSAALRIIVATQSSLGVSMLAAIIMETIGFKLKQSASLSIQRATGGLPFMLLETRLFLGRANLLLTFTILLCFTTIGSYFTSTALIADFELLPILGYPNEEESFYSLTNVATTLGTEPVYISYWPTSFPAFAEYSAPVEAANSTLDQLYVDDTGPTLRAILPLSSDGRQNLGTYEGYGTLLNSHVICVKPGLQNLVFGNENFVNHTFQPFINGSISLQAQPGGIKFVQSAGSEALMDFPHDGKAWGPLQSMNFSCRLTPLSNLMPLDWPISMCVAGNTLNYESGILHDTGRLATLGTRATSLLNDDILFDPLSYVLINYSSSTFPKTFKYTDPYTVSGNNLTEVESNFSSWRTFQVLGYKESNFSVSLTYCFSHFASIDAKIYANSSTNRVEPQLRRSNSSNFMFDASDVLRQLGADGASRSLDERGILSLQKDDQWSFYNYTRSSLALDGSYGFGMERNDFTPPRGLKLSVNKEYMSDYGSNSSNIAGTWSLCTHCADGTHTVGIHVTLSSIFQSSLQASRSMATALQALFTVVNMMQYYNRTVSPAIQPKHRMGLLLVTIGLLIHIATIIAITLLFHFRTKNSFIGQNWHTVAQLQNENAIPILEKASLMRDDEVEKMMREEGVDGGEVFFLGGSKVVENGG